MSEKKKISIIVIVSLIIMSMAFLAGCGSAKTVEKYFDSSDDAQKKIEDMEKNSTDENGSLDIKIKDNTISITYKFKETYSGDMLKRMKKSIDEIINNDDMTSYTEIIKDIKEDAGIEDDVTIEVVYLNGDGEELGSASIKK